ncbi:MAG TPA: YceI family protein [Candidatus Solibacter sp.]|nr:YceI family protein [Candidatus Solibacter sp.]
MDALRAVVEESSVRYAIDNTASSFFVKAFPSGLLSAFAHSPKIAIRDFHGSVSFTPAGGTLDGARLDVRIPSDSLEVVNDVSDEDRQEIQHRMHSEVLEADRFPEVSYQSSRIATSGSGDRFWVAMKGELTLHGVTRPLSITARVALNGDSLRSTGEFSILQTDFDINPPKAAGGTIRLKDELKFSFDILARKQE